MSEQSALAAALADFQAEMPTVAKARKATVPTKAGGSYSYTYASLPEVTDAAMPLLTKHGLSFACCPRTVDGGYELVGVLLHASGERMEGSLPIYGRTPQEIGSALTYNRRYLLGCMTGLVTDDDDDGQVAQGARRTEKPEKPMTASTRAALFATFTRKGIEDKAAQLAGINAVTGGGYTSRGDLTEAHAQAVIKSLAAHPDTAPLTGDDDV